MFTLQTTLRPQRLRLCDSRRIACQTFSVRHVSLNSAIKRGTMKGNGAAPWEGRGRQNSGRGRGQSNGSRADYKSADNNGPARQIRPSPDGSRGGRRWNGADRDGTNYRGPPEQRGRWADGSRNDERRSGAWKLSADNNGQMRPSPDGSRGGGRWNGADTNSTNHRGPPEQRGRRADGIRNDEQRNGAWMLGRAAKSHRNDRGSRERVRPNDDGVALSQHWDRANREPRLDESPWTTALRSSLRKGSIRSTLKRSDKYPDRPRNPNVPDDCKVYGKVFQVPPKAIPYATPASEFIYGTSAVQSAIRCGRRKLHVLYIYDEGDGKPMSQTKWESPVAKSLQKFALLAGAKVKRVTLKWDHLLYKMSKGRPHNGIVLDASPLPKLPADSLRAVESPSSTEFRLDLAAQPEEEAEVNGTNDRIQLAPYRSASAEVNDQFQSQRYPFILLLDGVLDPGNLGAIIRTAHYLGVDAVAFSARNSAPLSAVALKASAGAAESVPLISVGDPRSFIDTSRRNGWRFFAAAASASANASNDVSNIDRPVLSPSALSTQLSESPCVLMLGGEGEGLSRTLLKKSNCFVTVPGVYDANQEDDEAGVDSLNVSVATGLLCEGFLRKTTDLHAQGLATETNVDGAENDGNRIF